MTEKPEASVLTARRAAQHFRLSSADDACEHLYILTVRSSLGPSPPNAGRYTVASRFRCRSCERGYIFPRAPEQFVASPLCLVGYVRWDARSDRVPPLQTIIFSSFTGRTPSCPSSRRNNLLTPAETDPACSILPRAPHGVTRDSCSVFLASGEQFPSNQPAHRSLRRTLRKSNRLGQLLITHLNGSLPTCLFGRKPYIDKEAGGSPVVADQVAHQHVYDVIIQVQHGYTGQ